MKIDMAELSSGGRPSGKFLFSITTESHIGNEVEWKHYQASFITDVHNAIDHYFGDTASHNLHRRKDCPLCGEPHMKGRTIK